MDLTCIVVECLLCHNGCKGAPLAIDDWPLLGDRTGLFAFLAVGLAKRINSTLEPRILPAGYGLASAEKNVARSSPITARLLPQGSREPGVSCFSVVYADHPIPWYSWPFDYKKNARGKEKRYFLFFMRQGKKSQGGFGWAGGFVRFDRWTVPMAVDRRQPPPDRASYFYRGPDHGETMRPLRNRAPRPIRSPGEQRPPWRPSRLTLLTARECCRKGHTGANGIHVSSPYVVLKNTSMLQGHYNSTRHPEFIHATFGKIP